MLADQPHVHFCLHTEHEVPRVQLNMNVLHRIYSPLCRRYHVVSIGDLFKNRYKVVRKLGWGHFSTVWLVQDKDVAADAPHRYAALKIVKSARHYKEAAEDEVKLLRSIRDTDPGSRGRTRAVLLLDDFKHYGPHGTHICMVMEVLGHNLLKLIKQHEYKGIPMDLLRRIIRQCLQALAYMHDDCEIIHTDIKPENILLCMSPKEVTEMGDAAAAAVVEQGKGKGRSSGPGAAVGGESTGSASPGKLSKTQKRNLKRRQKAKEKKAAALAAGAGGDGDDDDDGGDEDDDDGDDAAATTTTAVASEACGDGQAAAAARSSSPPNPPPPKQPELPEKVKRAYFVTNNIKIADLGNACWVHTHFSPDIQTRQYRSPEVILGADYDASADVWSVACMAFELATGDFLFEPHSGEGYTRDEDHCALISELLGKFPKEVAMSGEYSVEVFDTEGELLNIHELKPWTLQEVLHEKYGFSKELAEQFGSFLLPMLDVRTTHRKSAIDCLDHPWLQESAAERAAKKTIIAHNVLAPMPEE